MQKIIATRNGAFYADKAGHVTYLTNQKAAGVIITQSGKQQRLVDLPVSDVTDDSHTLAEIAKHLEGAPEPEPEKPQKTTKKKVTTKKAEKTQPENDTK